MKGCLFPALAAALVTPAAVAYAVERPVAVECTVVAKPEPVDCSMGATLKRGYVPWECIKA